MAGCPAPSGQVLEVLTETDFPHDIEVHKYGPSGRIEGLVRMGAELGRQQVDFGFDPRLIGPKRWMPKRFLGQLLAFPLCNSTYPSRIIPCLPSFMTIINIARVMNGTYFLT